MQSSLNADGTRENGLKWKYLSIICSMMLDDATSLHVGALEAGGEELLDTE